MIPKYCEEHGTSIMGGSDAIDAHLALHHFEEQKALEAENLRRLDEIFAAHGFREGEHPGIFVREQAF